MVLKTLTPREEKVVKMRFGLETVASTPSKKWAKALQSPASASARSKPKRCGNLLIPRAGRKLRKPQDAREFRE